MYINLFDFSKFDNCPALISDCETVTYNQMNLTAESLCGIFVGKNLILQICTNTIGSIVGYTSFISLQQVPLLLDLHIKKEAVDELCTRYRPEYIYLPDYMVSDYRDFIVVKRVYNYLLLQCKYVHHSNINDNLALLLSTSGSLGSSRCVRLSYTNLYENACSIIKYLEIDSTKRPVTMLPMNYTYGLSVINSHLLSGASVVVTGRNIYDKEFWRLAKKEKITSICGVPYTYEMLYRMAFLHMHIPSLKVMTQAGGKLSEKLQREFFEYADKNNIRFFIMYGQTEATARMTYLPYKDAGKKIGSVGIAIPGGKIEIYVDNLPTDRPYVCGEIVYYGPNVSMGYADRRKDLSLGDEMCGKLYTGDIGYKDEDGYLYISGRKKRFVKPCGKRISLDELENSIKRMYEMEIYCKGNDEGIEICFTEKDLSKHEKIKNYVSDITGLYRSFIKTSCVESIPRNAYGKVVY